MKYSLTLALLLAAAAPAPAWAHAYPKTTSPAVGSTVHAAPTEVAIDFDDELEGAFSTISVQDAAGRKVDDGKSRLAPRDKRHLSVGVADLPPGTYRVEWRATDTDTHRTQGHFAFTVAP